MCSCLQAKKPHTEACRAAKRRWGRSPLRTRSRAKYELRRLGVTK